MKCSVYIAASLVVARNNGGDVRLELARTNGFASGLVQVEYRVLGRNVG